MLMFKPCKRCSVKQKFKSDDREIITITPFEHPTNSLKFVNL